MSFKNITVAGGGVLGSQIAFQTAYKGFNTTIWLKNEVFIQETKSRLEHLRNVYLETLEESKKNPLAWANGFAPSFPQENIDVEIDILKENVEAAFKNIKLMTSYEEAMSNCDFLIEAIVENPEEKIKFYTEAKQYLPEKTVIATNSSVMLPSDFAKYTGRPEKYLALHFSNRIQRFNIAEVMGHQDTDPKCYEQVVNFAEAIGMVPLRIHKEHRSYILNSLLVPLLQAAESLYVNGVASFEDIDRCWKISTGAPNGPFKIIDTVGLNTAYSITMMSPDAKDSSTTIGKIAAMLKERIDAGKLGISSGEGFYKYNK